MGTFAHWLDCVSESWSSTPGDDLLDPRGDAWKRLGTPPFTPGEQLALGTLGRLLKYKQSLALVLPEAGSETLRKLVLYLHRLRFDACEGWLRTPWLQPRTMLDRPHLVVWTRPPARLRDWAGTPGLRCHLAAEEIPRPEPGTPDTHTLLLDPAKSSYEQLVALEEGGIRPFAFVLDAGRTGRDFPLVAFVKLLREWFGGIPIVLMAASGDPKFLADIQSIDWHVWVLRLEDVRRWSERQGLALPPPAWSLIEVPDIWIDQRLTIVHDHYRALANLVRKDAGAKPTEVLRPPAKVLQGLRALTSDLNALESELRRHARGGPFPCAPLARWLEKCDASSCKFGETVEAHRALVAALRELYVGIQGGITGKAQAVVACARESLGKGERIRVLAGNWKEAAALEHWLEENGHSRFDNPHLEVGAMDERRFLPRAVGPVEHLLIAGIPWPSRQHWLASEAGRLSLLCYPFERNFYRSLLSAWWNRYGRASAAHGDKLRLWQLDVAPGYRLDQAIEGDDLATFLTERRIGCAGRYLSTPRVFELPFVDRHENWMERLLEEEAPIEEDLPASERTAENEATVLIYLEERPHPLCWPSYTLVTVLAEGAHHESLSEVTPDELEPGDRIILMHDTEAKGNILDTLFESFVEDSVGLEQHLEFAKRWLVLVHSVQERFKTAESIQRKLAGKGIAITSQAVGNWLRNRVIGPDNPQVVEAFCELCGWSQPAQRAQRINNAIATIRKERRRLGKDIRKAVEARANGHDRVTIGRVTLSPADLDSLFSIEVVSRIELPPFQESHLFDDAPRSPELAALPAEFQERYPDRLVFTQSCLRKIKKAEFKDIDRVRRCFELMATTFYDMYRNGSRRFHEVMEEFRREGIGHSAGTSASTQGKSDLYRKRYKSRYVDIGAHFKIGTAHDPSQTLRVHYHWDAEGRQVVIHEAGEHLPTRFS